MRQWSHIPMARLAVTLALIVALVGSSWGHRAPGPGISDDILAYVSAGGLLDDLCAEGEDTAAHDTCDACRLVDTMSLAGLGECASPLHGIAVAEIPLPAMAQPHLPVLDPVRLSRAPPHLI